MIPLLSAIGTGFKTLLGVDTQGGPERVMEVAKGVGGWIDGLSYTDQEKAVDQAAVSASVIEFVKSTVGENTARSVTRRAIALWIIRAEVLMWLGSAFVYPWDATWSEYFFKISSFSTPMGWGFMTVLIFFFGNYALRVMQGRS